MPTAAAQHPYLDLFSFALVPRLKSGPDHAKDPPAPHLLPLANASPEARQVLDLLLGADHDLRDDHDQAAGINLALAETRIRLAVSHGDKSPALQTALTRIALAREEMAKHDTRRACAALADAVRAVMAPAAKG
ncbi:hypothetical protein ACFQS7_04740 [Dankookia sp. GCM10030260]|uniref:hypothetical protein n=1 Tax=Dankookia sp. GCM10030260 TaxID=3273390 RepID=UPI00360ED02F